MNTNSKSFVQVFSVVGEEKVQLACFTSREMKTFLQDGCKVRRSTKLYALSSNLPVEELIRSKNDILQHENMSEYEKQEFVKFIDILSAHPVDTLFVQKSDDGSDMTWDALGLK